MIFLGLAALISCCTTAWTFSGVTSQGGFAVGLISKYSPRVASKKVSCDQSELNTHSTLIIRNSISIKEILEELPKLTPEERRAVREWLDAEECAETDELIAAVDEGFRSSKTEQSLSIEEVRDLIRRCATRSK
jgi:hypothetical protein